VSGLTHVTRAQADFIIRDRNMNGERLPLDWTGKLRFSLHHPNSYSLLDVAALVSTTSIDLSNHLFAPDFIALSFYKIFGFPDLGALIVRKAAGHVFDKRRYFGGGTTEMTTCLEESWVARKESSLHARLEDGTIAFRNILALKCAITTHRRLFGGLGEVSTHASWLARILHERLTSMTHYNGAPVCQIYKSEDSDFHNSQTQGPTIAFNVRRSDGTYIGPWHVGAFLRASRIHVRTGNVCNPAGIACALGVKPGWLRGAFDAGFRCNTQADLLEGVPIGIVRVTLGAISTLEDVHTLVSCLSRSVVEHRDHLHETAQAYSKKKEWVLESRSPSPVSESSTIRIEPAPPGSEKPMTVFKNLRSLVPWWSRRKRSDAHLEA
jgi:molybdenum cofactor sulfurtransferase